MFTVFLRVDLVTLFLNDMTRSDRLFKDSLISKLIYEHWIKSVPSTVFTSFVPILTEFYTNLIKMRSIKCTQNVCEIWPSDLAIAWQDPVSTVFLDFIEINFLTKIGSNCALQSVYTFKPHIFLIKGLETLINIMPSECPIISYRFW